MLENKVVRTKVKQITNQLKSTFVLQTFLNFPIFNHIYTFERNRQQKLFFNGMKHAA